MFYSEKFKLLVIGIPKTGAVSVYNALKEQLDKGGEAHHIYLNGMDYPNDIFPQGMINHARAREFKVVMGANYDQLRTVAFLRNPYSKLVSAYFYTRRLNLISIPKGRVKVIRRALRYTVSVLLARLFPFWLWVYLYPYRSSSSYIHDYDGRVIVDYLGRTDNMESDLNLILRKSGITKEGKRIKIEVRNKSKHSKYSDYYKWR